MEKGAGLTPGLGPFWLRKLNLLEGSNVRLPLCLSLTPLCWEQRNTMLLCQRRKELKKT